MTLYTYSSAILSGFHYLLSTYPEVFVIGQGLWSPWYVGNTMNDLENTYGTKESLIPLFPKQLVLAQLLVHLFVE